MEFESESDGRRLWQEITRGGAFSAFALDVGSGTIVRGSQDAAAQSVAILSTLIVTLLVAVGMLMFMQSPPVASYGGHALAPAARVAK